MTEKTVVMVTGGSGLVGSAIKDYVTANPKENEEWVFLSSKDGDLRDRKATEAIFHKFKPTHVIHLAAKVGGLFANMAQKVSWSFGVCVCFCLAFFLLGAGFLSEEVKRSFSIFISSISFICYLWYFVLVLSINTAIYCVLFTIYYLYNHWTKHKCICEPQVEFYRENTLINDNIMELCRINKVQKLVSFLSTCIFPDKTTYPIDETMLHDGPPHPSNEGYAYAKRLIDTMNRAYAEEYGCNFTSIIPTNIYGPHDNFSIQNGHVIPGLIHKCYVAKRDGTPFTIWGSGTPLRQFIYSLDLAELTVWVMRDYHSPDPITLSVDESAEVSIKDVALSVAKAMKFEGEVIFDTEKADGQFKKTACNKKLRSYLPDYKFKTMDEGIQMSVDWFLENYESARK